MYIKSDNNAGIDVLIQEEPVEIEHVVLGKIVTNYPLEEGEEPIYSLESYATIAPGQDIEVGPENEVGEVTSTYIHDYVNHYWGVELPIQG